MHFASDFEPFWCSRFGCFSRLWHSGSAEKANIVSANGHSRRGQWSCSPGTITNDSTRFALCDLIFAALKKFGYADKTFPTYRLLP